MPAQNDEESLLYALTHWKESDTETLIAALKKTEPVSAKRVGGRPAGVLVPLFVESGVLKALYIRRTRHYLQDGHEAIHSGQIAFPGGKVERGESATQAALREAEEEIGLPRAAAALIGKLGNFYTLTSGYEPIAFVAIVEGSPPLRRNQYEVDAIFRVPLADLAAQHLPDLHIHRYRDILQLHYHWQPPGEPAGICIWGMTGRMTWVLLSLLLQLGSMDYRQP